MSLSFTSAERGCLPSMEDESLVERFLKGEEAAFDRLFMKHQNYVYTVCHGIMGNTEDARDLTQETFLQVYRSLKGFRRRSSLKTWIYRIAVNCCLGEVRKRQCQRRTCPQETPFLPDSIPPWQPLEEKERKRHVWNALARIAPQYRAAIVLRYFEELSYEEIAEVMDCSLGQVKIRLHRARNAFKAIYQEEE